MDLLSAIVNAASGNKSGIIFIYPDGREEKVSYSDIYQNALRILGILQGKGLHASDELIILIDDNRLFLYVFWACILGKIIPIPLSAGMRSEHSRKLFAIWPYLFNPFVICDEEQSERLRKAVGPAGPQMDYELVSRRMIPLSDALLPGEAGAIAEVHGQDLAYIQFSSGSTGDPKGVCLTHDNLTSNITDIIQSLEITGSDILLSWMPLTHDMGLIGFHMVGMMKNIDTVSIPTSTFVKKPRIWMDITSAYRATVLYSPNFGFHYFLSAMEEAQSFPWDLSCIRIIVNGAEDISVIVCDRFTKELERYGLQKNAILSAYGLAEASVEVAAMPAGTRMISYCLSRNSLNIGNRIEPVEAGSAGSVGFVDVGQPVPSCQLRICDDSDAVLPDDTVGHIQIKGSNVTAGYYNNQAATKRLFTRDLWLRTGDIGFTRDGRLVVTGRLKNIIILNGQNYYPQDIERQVTDAGIAELGKVVACGTKDPITGRPELVIFVLYKASPDAFTGVANAVRDRVIRNIGIFVDRVIPVKKIPKTTSGKIQHFILAERYRNGEFDDYITHTEPSPVEDRQTILADNELTHKELAHIVSILLGRDAVGENCNLFESGMNSLIAMQLAARIRQWTGSDISVQAIFEHCTINDLHRYLLAAPAGRSMPQLGKAEYGDSFGLSLAQSRIWAEYQLNKESVAYNISVLYTIEGAFNTQLFEDSVRRLIRRYEILRTSFGFTEELALQKVHPFNDALFSVQYLDLSEFADGRTKGDFICAKDVNTPFVLENPSQLRVRAIRLTGDRHILVFVIHHILIDGWSLDKLFRELCDLYNNPESLAGLPTEDTPPLQFRDYVAWQKEVLASDSMADSRAYWLNELEELPDAVDLSGGSNRAVTDISVKVSYSRHSFQHREVDLLKDLAKKFETTPFVILMALLNTLLYRYTNSRDIVLGFDVAGRDSEEMERLIGYTLNTLCLRISPDAKRSFADMVTLVKQKHYASLYHQLYPFEELLADKRTGGNGYGNTLFKILVLYQNFYRDSSGLDLAGCTARREYIYVEDGFVDLLLEFTEGDNTLGLVVQYNESLYTLAEIERLAIHLGNLLTAVAHNDGQEICSYDFLTDTEKGILFPSGKRDADGKHIRMPVHLLFERRVRVWPDAIAVVAGDHSLSYRQLNKRANQIADLLKKKTGAGPEDRIGFLVDRNENMIIAMLAILKAGAAYVAIDPDLPSNRRQQIITDSGIKGLLTDNTTLGTANDGFHGDFLVNMDNRDLSQGIEENPAYEGSMNNLAYVIYTSGSTGQPKGVMIEHRSLFNYIRHFIHYFDITRQDVFIQQASVAFDTLIEEVFPALCTSGKVVIAKSGGKDIDELLSLIATHRITVLSTTPLVLNEINNRIDHRIESLRLAISGGDLLYPSHIRKLLNEIDIYNTYGPSESTVCVTYKKIASLADASLIGTPIAHCYIYILDENGQVMPVGKTGEIYIEGNLARGYLDLPSLTAEKFMTAPFDPVKKLYRSGDLGRWTEDGDIEFRGRCDYQIKVRGHRVEPEEIEKLISQYPAVKMAVVVLGRESEYLIAWLTVREGFSENGLRLYISENLPAYMMPYRFEIIDELPLTVTGKVDRNWLQVQVASLPRSTGTDPGQADDLEQTLLGMVAEILEVDRMSRRDNFFEHGCNSVRAVRLARLVYKELQYKIEIRDLFIYPTVELLTERIRQLTRTSYRKIMPVEGSPHYELSPAQERIWILSRLDKTSFAYNETELYEIEGDLDLGLVKRTFESVVERHEILRTLFLQVEDAPRQLVRDASLCTLNILYEDTTKSEDVMGRAHEIIETESREPFDLEQGPLYRIVLVRIAPDRCLLAVIMHHIITDDRTSAILINDFLALYGSFKNNMPDPLPAPKLQYKDYVYWINGSIQRQHLLRDRDYWLEIYKDEIPLLDLPCDGKRPPIKRQEGAAVFAVPDKALLTQLKLTSREHQVSLFMLLLSGLGVLLSKYTGQLDMVIGVPVAGREHPDLENIAGFFINTLPLRIQFEKDEKLSDLLHKVKQVCLGAYKHQSYPFDHLIRDTQLTRDLGRSPFFDVLINLRTLESREGDFSVDNTRFTKINKTVVGSKYDLAVYIEEGRDSLSCMIEYDTHLFTRARMERMMAHYTNILRSFAGEMTLTIDHLAYLTEQEKKQLLYDFNKPLVPFRERSVIDAFSQKVAILPDKIAVSCGDRSFTYRQIDALSDRLANHLVNKCRLKHNEPVALLLERSENIIISILAVWKAGATYLPIDPELPVQRMKYMLADTRASLILTDSDNLSKCEELKAYGHIQPVCVDKDSFADGLAGFKPGKQADLAYIIYTSGSTGLPKGVEVYHHAVANLLSALQKTPGITAQDTLLSVSAYTFDISVSEFFLPLVNGASLVIATRREVLDVEQLKKLFDKARPSFMQATPGLWSLLADTGWMGSAQLKAITCGEPLSDDLRVKLLRRVGHLWNMYGPTETTIFSTGKRITTTEETISIGSPLQNTHIYILDESREFVPAGVYGELYIGGEGVARGYLNRSDLSSRQFSTGVAGQEETLYATGDMGRWLPNGEIELKGRIDHQVKIRGFRIEPGEIENALMDITGVRSAIVIAKQDGSGERKLLAYIVYKDGCQVQEEVLRTCLRQRLPGYMIPAAFIQVPDMPLTGSGKIDRTLLGTKKYINPAGTLRKEILPPETKIEKILLALWRDILDRKDISTTDNFFDLGGHSLKANQLVNRIYREMGIEVSLSDIFINSTIRQLGDLMTTLEKHTYHFIELS